MNMEKVCRKMSKIEYLASTIKLSSTNYHQSCPPNHPPYLSEIGPAKNTTISMFLLSKNKTSNTSSMFFIWSELLL